DILKDCIPLIRFFHMDDGEYIKKVVPRIHLLPHQLCGDLICYKQTKGVLKPKSKLLPPRERVSTTKKPRNISDPSTSTSPTHKEPPIHIADGQSEPLKTQPEPRRSQTPSGINIDSPNTSHPPQEKVKSQILNDAQIQWVLSVVIFHQHKVKKTCFLKLLYQGSHDGYKPSVFHSLCDNQGPTITVIRTKENEIIGGYNPTSWDKTLERFTHTSYSFLFAVKSSGNVVSFCQKPATAVRNDPTYGPAFGTDLVLFGGFTSPNNYTYQDVYDMPIRDSSEMFAVREIEVFQVTF
ncbi:2384_t:CDS:2, partial [Paraglomus brasilianum]